MFEQEETYFDIFDYVVFAVMLLVSAGIGLYFACFAKVKQNTTAEYLMGSKTMGIFPISMSLIASYISGISVLGMPAEMYTYGTQFWMILTSELLVSLTMAFAYLPVFYTLQITSSYEYLNLRFNQTVRLLGSTLFLLKMLLYIPIVIYVPALAFSQVTGINLHLITPIVCIVCIFYTTLEINMYGMNRPRNRLCAKHLPKPLQFDNEADTGKLSEYENEGSLSELVVSTPIKPKLPRSPELSEDDGIFLWLFITFNLLFSFGAPLVLILCPELVYGGPILITFILLFVIGVLGGLKAVVWTDTVQTAIMFGALICVVVMGTISVGGVAEVWRINEEGQRLEFFNFNWDPTIRHTFWTVSIGNYFGWLASCSINQAMVQRCLAMPTLKKARYTVLILVIGISSLVSMCCFMGLLIYAAYHKCDPVTRGSIGKSDQLLPYFVMKIAAFVPGLPGLFVSGVFSAALSSMSTGLNSMTGVIFEDLIKPNIRKPLTESRASFLMKVIVVVIGSICVSLVFLVEKMGMLIQASGSLSAITAGPLLGIFTLGMFFPFANPIGALSGGIVSGSLVGWISIGTQLKMATKEILFPQKPISIEGCSSDWLAEYVSGVTISKSNFVPPDHHNDDVFFLYRLSYMYYTALGAILAILVGALVSCMTGCNRKRRISKDLLSPVIHGFLDDEPEVISSSVVYETDDTHLPNANRILMTKLTHMFN